MVPGAPPAWSLSCQSIYSPVGTNSPAGTPGAGSRVTGCVCPGDHEPAAGSGRRLAGCGLGRESRAPEDSPGQGQRCPTRQLSTRHSLPGKTGRPPQLSLFLAVASCRGDTSADTPTQGCPGWGFLPRNPLESGSCRAPLPAGIPSDIPGMGSESLQASCTPCGARGQGRHRDLRVCHIQTRRPQWVQGEAHTEGHGAGPTRQEWPRLSRPCFCREVGGRGPRAEGSRLSGSPAPAGPLGQRSWPRPSCPSGLRNLPGDPASQDAASLMQG